MVPLLQPTIIVWVFSSHATHVIALGSCVWLTIRIDLGSTARRVGVPSTMNINLLPVSKTIPDIAQWEWRSFSRPERLSKSTICISPVAKPQAIARPSDRKLMTEGQAHSVSISKMKRWVFMSNRARRLRLPPIHNRRLMHEHPVRLNVVYKTGT